MRTPVFVSQILRNIVRAQLADGKLDAAEQTAREAITAARRAGGGEEPAMLSVAAQLSFQRGRLAEAVDYIEQSFAGVDLTKSSMPMREAHLTAYRIHRKTGDGAKALAHLEALKRLDDEATKLATQTSTALMGARFDFANQELRIERLRAERLRRSMLHEQERTRTERFIFAGAAGAALLIMALLGVGFLLIRRSRDAVRAANAGLEVTNAALEKALAAKTEFLATTSHEIRTPLNGILGMAQVMLADRTLPEGARDRVRLLHGAGVTMRALVDDILDMAKIAGGKLKLEAAAFDLRDLLLDAPRLWEDQIRAKGVAFEAAVDLAPGLVAGDAARLRQIVLNLLSNAAKFTESGSITLGARRLDGDRYEISVADTGVGIAADKLERVFDSFAQADASVTRRFGGTGLGLAISRNLARAMGGDLTVGSSPGRGSTFTLTIPLAPCTEAAPVEKAEACGVLVVASNPIMRAMLRSLLEPQAGRVVPAADAEEALAAIEAHAPRAVLVDDGVAGGIDRLAAAAHARGLAVTLLRSPDAQAAEPPASWRIVGKPVTKRALVEAVLATDDRADSGSGLETRAA